MESFYGGKQGRSYKIVQHFDSVKAMVDAFQQGGTYTDVGYDEYVIIDTIINNNDKTNPENGLLYRRGYNYSEVFNVGGVSLDTPTGLNIHATIATTLTDGNKSVAAQVPKYKNYTFTILGDSAPYTPDIEITGVNDIWQTAWTSFVTHPGGGAEYIGQIVGPTGDSPAIELTEWSDFKTIEQGAEQIKGHIVVQPRPGYNVAAADTEGYDAQGFHDEIQYGYYTIRDANNNITGAVLAFDIPYTVFTFQAESITPYDTTYGTYDSDTQEWSYEGLISEQFDSEGHPYYKHYDIKVPKGIHGRDVTEVGIQGTPEQQNQKWYYETKTYDAEANPISERHVLQGFRNIYNINRVGNGDFYVNYTDTTTGTRLPIGQIYRLAHKNDLILVQFKDVPGTNENTYYNENIEQIYPFRADGDSITTYWVNLGNIYANTQLFGHFADLATLKAAYPYGFGKDTNGDPVVDGTENRAGWLATVNVTDGIALYGYDYRGTYPTPGDGWYEIQAVGAAAVNQQLEPRKSIVVADAESQPADEVQNIDGIWLVES